MATTTEYSVDLIKNHVSAIDSSGGCRKTRRGDKFYEIDIFGKSDLTLIRQAISSPTLKISNAVYDYFAGKENGYNFAYLIGRRKQEYPQQVDVHISLNKEFVSRLCSIMPQLFIRVNGNITNWGVNYVRNDPVVFNKRIDLHDILNEGVNYFDKYDKQQTLRQSLDYMIPWEIYDGTGLQLTCNISVGYFMRNIEIMTPQPTNQIEIRTRTPEPTSQIKINTNSFIQNLFENESTKDLTIVARNGATVKCHRIIFAAHSNVLSAMISSKTGMMESQTGRIEMWENSAEGLKHLIRYLYGMEVITTDMNCDVALELLQTAHKYELTHLQECVQKLFLKKDVNWFTPDNILKLHFYVMNVSDFDALTVHSLDIMVSMDMDKLMSCDGFKYLHKFDSMRLLGKLVKWLQGGTAKPTVLARPHVDMLTHFLVKCAWCIMLLGITWIWNGGIVLHFIIFLTLLLCRIV